jgi:hypothetical protein
MDKATILREIKRTAEANGGAPLGAARFRAETGIGVRDWRKWWARWGDAAREAGFAPNPFGAKHDQSQLLEKYAQFARELGRLPTSADLRLKARQDDQFPSMSSFDSRWRKCDLVARLLEHCRDREGYDDVVRLCEEYSPRNRDAAEKPRGAAFEIGFVYLIKSGRYFKIGKTNAVGRREYELAIQLPEKPKTVHVIRTDDPDGIEGYWHKRFAEKRKNGEWFDLTNGDVAAFKRRKFM